MPISKPPPTRLPGHAALPSSVLCVCLSLPDLRPWFLSSLPELWLCSPLVLQAPQLKAVSVVLWLCPPPTQAEALLAEFPAEEVTVLLKKPRAPVGADFAYMAVEITKRRTE